MRVAAMFLLLFVVVTACSRVSGAHKASCVAASEWRTAAQDLLYESNDFRDPNEYKARLVRAFRPLGNVAIPPPKQDKSNSLLPLMQEWREQVERWISAPSE